MPRMPGSMREISPGEPAIVEVALLTTHLVVGVRRRRRSSLDLDRLADVSGAMVPRCTVESPMPSAGSL